MTTTFEKRFNNGTGTVLYDMYNLGEYIGFTRLTVKENVMICDDFVLRDNGEYDHECTQYDLRIDSDSKNAKDIFWLCETIGVQRV